jgi:hypothetical protein
MKDRIVQQGDSLGWDGDEEMLNKVKWFLHDVAEVQGKWTEGSLVIPNQGCDSGSCGIVALSTIESFSHQICAPGPKREHQSFAWNGLVIFCNVISKLIKM